MTIRRVARPARSARSIRVEALEGRDLLSTFTVSNVADAGPGSFRQAILDNNVTPGTNAIDFAIGGGGVQTITLVSPLPAISNPAIVDATTQPGYDGTPLVELNGANIFETGVTPPTQIANVAGLVLSGGASTVKGLTIDRFTGDGIDLKGDGNTIAANFIGTDTTGTRASGNGGDGISILSRNNLIGGPTATGRNLISGNALEGIYLGTTGGLPSFNTVEGNLIGTNVTGTIDVGNGSSGVDAESSNNVIGGPSVGLGNTIAFNGGAGVQVGSYYYQSGVTNNRIGDNSIFQNSGLGIDLGNDGVTSNFNGGFFGPNLLQNFPSLSSAYASGGGSTTVEGTLNAQANSTYTVAFYASPQADPSGFGEGQTPIGSGVFTTDASGRADITSTLPTSVPIDQFLSATATDSTGNTSEFSRSLAVRSSAQADLSLTASNPNPSPQANVAQSYTYFVQNNGPSNASNVVFTNILPIGATFLSGTSGQGTLVQSGGTVTANLGGLASGASTTITLTYSIATPGPALSQASVRADQPDPSSTNNTITQNFQVTPAPPTDLSISGTDSPFPAQIGGDLTYTFLVINNTFADQATGVTVADPLPEGVTFVSARSSQGVTTEANGVVDAALGTLPGGFNATVTVVVRPTVAGPLSNTATVKGNEPDPDATNNSTTVVTTVVPLPTVDLAVAITAAPQPAQVGQGFSYVVFVANAGTAPATGVTLTNVLPDVALVTSIRSTEGTYTLAGTNLTAAIGNLAPGQFAAVTIVLRAGAPGIILDQATVSADQIDVNVANNYSALATTVVADQTAPVIINQRLKVSNKTITNVVLTFDKALDPVLASNPANYAIQDLGSNGSLSADGPALGIASAAYDPITRSVTITTRGRLSVGRFYKLIVNGTGAPGLEDNSGNVLDGVRNGLQNSIYESLIGRGTVTRPIALQAGAAASGSTANPTATPTATSKHKSHVHASAIAPRKVTTLAIPRGPKVQHHA